MQKETNSNRLALAIGNSVYEVFPSLENPKNDAEDVKVKLESLGFAVDHFEDCMTHEMLRYITEFTKRIHNNVTDIVFYYAGHGCSISKSSFNSFLKAGMCAIC